MKKLLLCLAVCLAMVTFSGCTLSKHMTYFQNMDSIDISQSPTVPVVRVKSNDQLLILVSSINADAAMPFNMNLNSSHGSVNSSTAGNSLYTYIVDADGNVNLPVLGKVKVKGMSRPEIEDMLTEKIKPYFAEDEKPMVKVTLNNFKVTVIGEVSGTKVINVDNERLSIVEALAQAGDMSIYGKRTNILLVRENMDGVKMATRLNMNDARIFNSEFYYLQQNDIVYIEPNKAKARSADVNSYTFWTPLTSIAMSLASMVLSITR